MAKQDIIYDIGLELESLNRQITSLREARLPVQLKINQLASPASQIDEKIAELTVDINKKIYDMVTISATAESCGCGLTALIVVPADPETGIGSTSYTVSTGTTVFYEHAKTHRIQAENTSYEDVAPYDPLSGTDGSTSYNSGIGSNTIVVGSNRNSILEVVVVNSGSGFVPSTYYAQDASGGSGTGAKLDVIVSSAGSITNAVVNNGGSGYSVNDTLTISGFSGASFRVTDVGSPILGNGVDTYIVSSDAIGSAFLYDVSPVGISSCPTTCTTYSNQISSLQNELTALRTQRDVLINGTNSIKEEMKSYYTERYSYSFCEGEIKKRQNNLNNIINVLNDPIYNQYYQ